jgi:hypothetical protein
MIDDAARQRHDGEQGEDEYQQENADNERDVVHWTGTRVASTARSTSVKVIVHASNGGVF